MAEADVFDPQHRVELIDGEVMDMSPIGLRHAACVDRLAVRFILGIGERAIVRVQGPVQVGERSEPQPDLVVMRYRSNFYADHHPMPPDILLVVEVSDTSLGYDLDRKTPLYLAGGVPEAWVVDLVADVVHVAWGDEGQVLRPGEAVSPIAFPDVVLDVSDILGLS